MGFDIDPHIPAFDHDGFGMTGVEDLDQVLKDADCTVIATDHTWYKWDEVRSKAQVIVDTRNALANNNCK